MVFYLLACRSVRVYLPTIQNLRRNTKMANNQFNKIHTSLRIEVQNKVQRKNKSIRKNAQNAAKRMYKELRPTIVMHLVRGNNLHFKLDEELELLIYVSKASEFDTPQPSTAPTIKLACMNRKKRNKLSPDDRSLFDKIYISELKSLLNLESLNRDEYNLLRM